MILRMYTPPGINAKAQIEDGLNAPLKHIEAEILSQYFRLIELSKRLLQLTLVHSHQLKADADTQVTVFRVVNLQEAKDQIVYLNTQLRKQARTIVKSQLEFKHANKQLKLAIIAELLSEVS